jgi:phage-related tail fiber protein
MAGVFKEAVLTAKGIALLAKAQAGRCAIKLTKAATGDGSYSDGEALTNRTALKSKKQEFALITVTTQNQSNVYVKFIITNKQDTGNLKNGYYVKEVGIYAQDRTRGKSSTHWQSESQTSGIICPLTTTSSRPRLPWTS